MSILSDILYVISDYLLVGFHNHLVHKNERKKIEKKENVFKRFKKRFNMR